MRTSNSRIALAAAIIVALSTGFVIGRFGPGARGGGSAGQASFGALGADGATAPAAEVPDDIATPRAADAPRPQKKPDQFSFQRLKLDTSDDVPKACLEFSAPIATGGQVQIEDYLQFDPPSPVTVEVHGSTLCISGLGFADERHLTIRTGLPAADGSQLGRSETMTISFGDRPAFVGFAGEGTVLPRTEADGLGIESVNVSKIKISVSRVGDRILARNRISEGRTTPEGEYGWWDWQADEVAVPVWEGKIDVASESNVVVTTVFPLGAALGSLKPGVYYIRLEDASSNEGASDSNTTAKAWRWIVFTDLALTTYWGATGVDVFVRSLESTQVVAGVDLVLVAQNNDELGRARTDRDGRAHFAAPLLAGTGPLVPRMIMAYGPRADYAVLDLQRPPLDLSDREVGGRAAPPQIDSYLYLDRGIYRPGETVLLTALVRDHVGAAVTNREGTLIIRRPNSTEAARLRVQAGASGAFAQSYEVPRSAPRGVWRATFECDGGGGGDVPFSVEDFVPQRLAVEVDADQTPLRPGESRPIEVTSRFLYGAPGANLSVEGEARLRIDPQPFPTYSTYTFGVTGEEFGERLLPLAGAMTDATGHARLSLALDAGPRTTLPARADVVVGVFEPGGRVVRESTRIPVRFSDLYLGIEPKFKDGRVSEGGDAAFNVIAVDARGERIDIRAHYRIVEEQWSFDWYRQNGEWRWRRSSVDVLVTEDFVELDSRTPASIVKQLPWGNYRLIVGVPGQDSQTSLRFHVGWGSYAGHADSPDRAVVTGPATPGPPGSPLEVGIAPPYAGEAQIVIASDRVLATQQTYVGASGTTLEIPTQADWGPGVYVLVTIVTPRSPLDRPVPRRAVGVTYVTFDQRSRTIGIALVVPSLVRPRQKLTIPLKLTGIPAREKAWLTLAAVDEGILRLTKFESPNPLEWYYGKRGLGVRIHDDYGRLLDPNLGAPSRFGGDQLGGEGLTVVPVKSVALYVGPIEVGRDGRATVSLDIPDFNGELRLMAVVWSAHALGALAQPLIVRDAVPADLVLPRFMAPGDQPTATCSIDNVEGPTGSYAVRVTATGAVSGRDGEQELDLGRGQRRAAGFALTADQVGIGDIALAVAAPDRSVVERRYPIEVRSPHLPVTLVETALQKPGETYTLPRDVLAGFAPGTGAVTVSYSPIRGIDPGPLLDSLWRYPYGCSEQLVSTAFPLLFVDELGGMLGRDPATELRPRVQNAINQMLDRQSADGSFGLWRTGDGAAAPWLGVYVTDFLARAKDKGYAVPDAALANAYVALGQVSRPETTLRVAYASWVYGGTDSNDSRERMRSRAAAYALYVLARAGHADLSELRYFHDALLAAEPSPLARGQIGAALLLMGDRARASSAFAAAEKALGYTCNGDYYQSALRDVAGLLALAAEARDTERVDRFAARLDREMRSADELHTQEQAHLLLAASALLRSAGPARIAVGNRVAADMGPTPRFAPSSADIDTGTTFRNDGSGPLWRSVMRTGAPLAAPPAVNAGFTLTKRILDRSGQPTDLAALRQGDRVVIAVDGAPQDRRFHSSIVVDLLPAGFEIEAILRPEDGDVDGNRLREWGTRRRRPTNAVRPPTPGAYAWLGAISATRVAESRDDRFVAALELTDAPFTLAYVARLVTPGTFALPGAVIEDMYRPGVMARTEIGHVTIKSAGN